MLEIRTLGRLDVRRSDGHEVASVLGAPKRFALLVHLAVESRKGPRRRDALLALFWPEKDGRSARNALNVTLHELRSALGRDAIVSHGAELVGVDPEGVRCDAVEFAKALEQGRPEDALGLYAGEFLPGFHLSDTPGFERWLDRERDRIRRGALDAVRTLARGAGDEGRPDVAIRWLRRGLSIAPLDERLVRRLLERLDEVGDRAGAIRAYETFAERLAAELEVEPSPETREMVEAIRTRSETNGQPTPPSSSRGVRGRPARAEPRSTAAPREPASPDEVPSARGRSIAAAVRDPVRVGVVLLFALALGLVATRVARGPRGVLSAPEALDPALLMIVPFETTGADPDVSRLARGMLHLLGSRLHGEPGPRALDPRKALWEIESEDAAGARTLSEWRAFAAENGAGRLVRGSVVGRPSNLVLAADLVDVASGEVRASASVRGAVTGPGARSPIALVDRLVARLLTIDAGEPRARLAALSPSLQAVLEYLAGKEAYRRGQIRAAYDAYDQALDHDSTFVLAALGLLETCHWPGIPRCYWRAKRLAWQRADALNRTDRLYLRVIGGENYDSPDEITRFDAARAARGEDPEPAGIRFEWADEMLHHPGRRLRWDGDVDVVWDRAEAAFASIVADYPMYEPALEHWLQLALGRREWKRADSLAAVYLERFPDADASGAVAWWRIWLREDEVGKDSLLAILPTLGKESLERLRLPGFYIPGMDLAYVIGALDVLDAPDGGGKSSDWYRWRIAFNRGRPSDARGLLKGHWIEELAVVETALYSVGDSADAASVVARLSPALTAPLPPADDLDAVRTYGWDLCLVEQWRLWHGETSTAERSIERLRSILPAVPSWTTTGEARECPILLDAIVAVLDARPDARESVARLDSLLATADGGTHLYYAHMPAALLWERLGEPERALVSIRRRCRFYGGVRYPADELRIEGRLLARLGRTDEAIRAYEHYLSLRSDPEPSVRPEVERVRAELNRLKVESDG